jgi:hypothetical protein
MKNSDKPAYPVLDKLITEGVDQGLELKHAGLTKREMFAMAAMQGVTMRHNVEHMFPHEIAKRAIEIADETLKQLEQ